MNETPTELKVSISSVEDRLWEGDAQSVSSENQSGAFDILPGHANFITMIEGKPIIIRTGSEEKTFNYHNAVLYVYEGEVRIFAGL